MYQVTNMTSIILFLTLISIWTCHGNSDDMARIVNGKDADPFDWKFVVAIYQNISSIYWYHCTGVIITKWHILTAAPCVPTNNAIWNYGIVSGTTKISLNIDPEKFYTLPSAKLKPGIMYRKPSRMSAHPDFVKKTYLNDIAIITVNKAFDTRKESISIIPLLEPEKPKRPRPKSSKEIPKVGDICDVAGWGSTRPILSIEEFIQFPIYPSDKLQKTQVKIWSREKCKETYEQATLQYGISPKINARNLCAAGKRGQSATSICFVSYNFYYCMTSVELFVFKGDAGAPLICKDKEGTKFLAGISAWSFLCGNLQYPGVYSHIKHFRDWIDAEIYISTPRSSNKAAFQSSNYFVLTLLLLFEIYIRFENS